MTAYDNLVRRINEGLKSGGVYSDDFVGTDKMEFDEVNPWTYWQGKGVRKPRIMVVGQDWGSINQLQGYVETFKRIKEQKMDDKKVHYFETKSLATFKTDENLNKYFDEALNIKDILEIRYNDLFFTNLIPGFRKSGLSTGGFKKSWITAQVKEDFKELIHILQPQVVLCLGRTTFEGVMDSLSNSRPIIDKWNVYLDERVDKPVEYIIAGEDGEKSVSIFPMAHTGSYGVSNRGIDKVEGDWRKIREWLENNECI